MIFQKKLYKGSITTNTLKIETEKFQYISLEYPKDDDIEITIQKKTNVLTVTFTINESYTESFKPSPGLPDLQPLPKRI